MFSHFLRKLGTLTGKPTATVVVGRLAWVIEPESAAVLGSEGPDFEAWLAAGRAELVKQNIQRQVYRVRLPGGTVYVKRCRASTPRSWAREALRPAKARLEYENARTLRARGIEAIEPLAWGSVPGPLPGDSYLITRAREAARPFVTQLETPLTPADRRLLAAEFARFMARLHDAGITHPDPHPGNFLVEWSPNSDPVFVLTDLHAVRFGRPLDWPAVRANLVLLNRWFQVRAERTDRLRFWRAYLDARSSQLDDVDSKARDLEVATTASNLRFWSDRHGRYTGNNSDSRRVHGPRVTGYAVRELPDSLLQTWFSDPEKPFRSANLIKDSRSSTVAEVEINTPNGPRVVIYKRLHVKTWAGAVKNLFRSPPAMRSWIMGNSVRDRGLPTARPLAVWHCTRFGVPLTGYIVCEKVPDAVGLPEAVTALAQVSPQVRRKVMRVWADRLGRLVRRMHEREISHRDLKAPNVLMSGADPLSARPVLIDLVGVEAGRPVSEPVRVRNLARLNASFHGSSSVTRADRLRVFLAYLGHGPRLRGDWKGWWRRINRATQRKVELNRSRGRPLA